MGKFTSLLTKTAYLSWRIFKGDVIGGMQRRIRRSRKVFLDDCPGDNIDYHAVREGVDQEAIAELFDSLGFQYRIIQYFSTQSRFWQPIGAAIDAKNTFAIIAVREPSKNSL